MDGVPIPDTEGCIFLKKLMRFTVKMLWVKNIESNGKEGWCFARIELHVNMWLQCEVSLIHSRKQINSALLIVPVGCAIKMGSN